MIRKLSVFIGSYRKFVSLVPIIVFLDVLAELSMPLLMGRIVDAGIPNRDLGAIARIGALMVLLALAAIALGVLNMRLTTDISTGFGANLRNRLFEKVQTFSFAGIDRFSPASLITRLTGDVNNLQLTLMMALRILVRAPLMLVIAFGLAFSINARLSLIMAAAIPVMALGVLLIMRYAVPLYMVVQERVDAVNNIVQENLIGVRVVKSYVRADHEIEKFTRVNDNLTEAGIRAATVSVLTMPLLILVLNGATLAIIWFGGRMVSLGGLGAGQLIAYLSYVMQILMSVMMISMIILMTARAEAGGRRVLEVLEAADDLKERPAGTEPGQPAGKIEFRSVSFKYDIAGSGENVLCDITFTIEPGETVGVIGGTGTGKTTLVHLIPRLYDATEGAVLVDGVDVRDYPLEALRKRVGIVLQANTLFTGTIRENLLWGDPDAGQEEIETACRLAQAHDFIQGLPDGYDTLIEQGGVNLSGGQRQRLSIARAMLKKPAILILDDSTSAVDVATETRIREAFSTHLKSTTVLIIAQRISSVREADKIIVLDDGHISAIGAHAELLERSAIYREINASQQEGALSLG